MTIPKRPLILAGVILLMAAIAALVARPRAEAPAAVPYAGLHGASLVKAAGLIAYRQRGDEVQALEPGNGLRAGDRLLLKVRTDQPRYLEVRRRGGGQAEQIIFPAGAEAAPVRGGEMLPAVTMGDGPARLIIVAYFADHAFPVGRAPGPDLLPVLIEVPKEP
ncbi:MAG TPA: hypothetical protein VH374_24300 [Polyangia bacterium]|jgi:hypothetical protein|nr:hypothetical protein [Polyangia bacterium]